MSERKEYECKSIQGAEWKTEDMVVRCVKTLNDIVGSHNETLLKLLDLTEKLEKRLDALESNREK